MSLFFINTNVVPSLYVEHQANMWKKAKKRK